MMTFNKAPKTEKIFLDAFRNEIRVGDQVAVCDYGLNMKIDIIKRICTVGVKLINTNGVFRSHKLLLLKSREELSNEVR